MNRIIPLLGLLLVLPGLATRAAEDPAHAELRELRSRIVGAITAGNLDALMPMLHTNVVVTWQNAEVCRGREGVRAFFQKTGKAAFRGYKVPPEPDELTILHGGDTGVSFGRNVSQLTLPGKKVDFENRWTATLVREGNQWQLASYHVSINAFDNPLLNGARNLILIAAGVSGLAGMALAWWLSRRRNTRPA
jgi:ketosteroid isomerase-like protein